MDKREGPYVWNPTKTEKDEILKALREREPSKVQGMGEGGQRFRVPSADPRNVEVATIVHPSGAVLRLWAKEAIDSQVFEALRLSVNQHVTAGLPIMVNADCRVEVVSQATVREAGCAVERRIDGMVFRFEGRTPVDVAEIEKAQKRMATEEPEPTPGTPLMSTPFKEWQPVVNSSLEIGRDVILKSDLDSTADFGWDAKLERQRALLANRNAKPTEATAEDVPVVVESPVKFREFL